MTESNSDSKRVAINTLVLYCRMFGLMVIGLFTSRITLNSLGVDNFGIYNVVGGFVVMFSIFSSSLTAAISRFITVELGKGDQKYLKEVFFTSVSIQIIMSAIIIVLAEILGLWFLFNKMTIPDGRIDAAQWVLHCSVISFAVGLISIPYNSVIVAHEKMSAFAYIGILEAIMKLLVAYFLYISPVDKLKTFAFLLLCVQIILRLIYGIYCKRHFDECRGHLQLTHKLFKEIWGFTSWNLLTNGVYILNTQGVNMIMNIYFGVVVNAARGIANQVNNAVQQFVNNFTMAITPQIIKSYATGNIEYSLNLTCRASRFAFFLMFIIALPVMVEADILLKFWLGSPPEYSASFMIWTILVSLSITVGTPLVSLIMANGNIKKYQIWMAILGLAPFPATWISFWLGGNVKWAYFIFFLIYYILIYIRMWLAHSIVHLPYSLYLKGVLLRIHIVFIISSIPPIVIKYLMEESMLRFTINCSVCIITSALAIFSIGITQTERTTLLFKGKNIIKEKLHLIK